MSSVSEPAIGGPDAPVFYSYRPLTDAFIDVSREILAGLPSHEPAVRALAECEALDVYLAQRGEVRMPAGRRALAEASLTAYLRAVFAQRTEFGFEPAHFETGYAELERAVYEVPRGGDRDRARARRDARSRHDRAGARRRRLADPRRRAR